MLTDGKGSMRHLVPGPSERGLAHPGTLGSNQGMANSVMELGKPPVRADIGKSSRFKQSKQPGVQS